MERPLKHVAAIRVSNVDKKSADNEEPVLLCNYTDVYYHERITNSLDFMAATATSSQRAVFGLREHDVLLTKDSETADDIGVSAVVAENVPGLVCGYHLALVRPRDGHATGRYLRWALATASARQRMSAVATGVTRFGLRSDAIRDLLVPIPDLAAQRRIADYLDRETTRIDGVIAAKRKLLSVLDERRRAVRDEAFASNKGLRLKRLLASPMAYGVLVPEFVPPGEGVPMIRIYNVMPNGFVSHEDIAEIPTALADEYRRTTVRAGDMILSVVGSMGRSAVITKDEDGYNLNRALARLRLRPDLPPRLLWHWSQTTHYSDMAKLATGRGTAQPTLNLGDLANFNVGLPPTPDSWCQILMGLEDACGRLDDAERAVHDQLRLLQEHREALISATVGGQAEI